MALKSPSIFYYLIACFWLYPHISLAQFDTTGIHFESGLSWTEIQAKAKAENKYIFMDCYATWCGPCKFMSKHIFTKKGVGEYMNQYFINVAVQVDQTPADVAEVKNWYTDAKFVVDKFSINELPTYLIFDPAGHPVHRIVGATGNDPMNFIVKVKEAFDSSKQYYTFVNSYSTHPFDSAFLKKALISALDYVDIHSAMPIAEDYVKCVKNPFNVEDLKLLIKTLQFSNSSVFKLFLTNSARIDSILGSKGSSEGIICNIIQREKITPLFLKDTALNWENIRHDIKVSYPELSEVAIRKLTAVFENEIRKKEIIPIYNIDAPVASLDRIAHRIKKKYPGYDAKRMIALERCRYFNFKKMWRKCDESVLRFMKIYGDSLDSKELNTMAWDFAFLHSENRKVLVKALEWSKRSIPDSSNRRDYYSYATFEHIDTYANLLYKCNVLYGVGNREQAIFWEKRVVELANLSAYLKSQEISYKNALDRMQRGEDTWTGRDKHGNYQ